MWPGMCSEVPEVKTSHVHCYRVRVPNGCRMKCYWHEVNKNNLRVGLDIEVFCDDGKTGVEGKLSPRTSQEGYLNAVSLRGAHAFAGYYQVAA